MKDNTIVYSTYYNAVEANIIRARLQDSGIDCFLADENVATLNPFYNQAIGGIKLIVFERDVVLITELLSEETPLLNQLEFEEYSGEETSGVLCENCNSRNVGYGMATKHKHRTWVIIISFILFVLPFFANKCYHCYDCGHEFK